MIKVFCPVSRLRKFAFTLAEVFHPVSRLHKYAFTLAEVLITVGIIGVVASLTMPTVIANYQDKANITLLRKTVNDFVNAADTYTTEEGKAKFSHTGALKDRDGLDNFIRAKFKIISSTNGFAASYKSIDGSKKNFSCDGLKYTLADSVSVCIDNTSSIKQVVSGASGEPEIKEVCSTPKNIHIYVDVNGEKNPNIGGKDMFDFYINEFGEFITSLGEPSCNEMYNSDSFDDNYTFKYLLGIGTACKKNPFGENCTEAIQDNNWKINY